jgi:hypothetical protein
VGPPRPHDPEAPKHWARHPKRPRLDAAQQSHTYLDTRMSHQIHAGRQMRRSRPLLATVKCVRTSSACRPSSVMTDGCASNLLPPQAWRHGHRDIAKPAPSGPNTLIAERNQPPVAACACNRRSGAILRPLASVFGAPVMRAFYPAPMGCVRRRRRRALWTSDLGARAGPLTALLVEQCGELLRREDPVALGSRAHGSPPSRCRR